MTTSFTDKSTQLSCFVSFTGITKLAKKLINHLSLREKLDSPLTCPSLVKTPLWAYPALIPAIALLVNWLIGFGKIWSSTSPWPSCPWTPQPKLQILWKTRSQIFIIGVNFEPLLYVRKEIITDNKEDGTNYHCQCIGGATNLIVAPRRPRQWKFVLIIRLVVNLSFVMWPHFDQSCS